MKTLSLIVKYHSRSCHAFGTTFCPSGRHWVRDHLWAMWRLGSLLQYLLPCG